MDLPTYPKVFEKLRPQIAERKSVWVLFPHLQQQRLLPVYNRSRKMVPTFGEDGKVTFEFSHPDAKLIALVDEFYTMVATINGGNLELTQKSYGSFMALVRHLILTSYDLTDAEVSKLLTISISELSDLVSTIFKHLQKK